MINVLQFYSNVTEPSPQSNKKPAARGGGLFGSAEGESSDDDGGDLFSSAVGAPAKSVN